ncbi:hypothetical protein KC327_g5339 [Hortaea werneckii]|uniref:Nuclear pore complex component n=1 Tax=Hortaea werneckii EXF-2000 TaxID=1157616 RepID=A0A1Z5SVC0_HORWE|nr:hypothetical protein KC358_g4825 [Hortaea werneckii]OTA24754.1 hypothetical protein BTJ68_13414 [Hortaea werneckii EXF-2000]KAI6912225.1 hypothetical protein KC348_g12734 [Hortaea werneckii]KAI6978601.1 hypothetical protein KC321_g2798 [Hortaea werneckii]KAI7039888.1 hypothetical protein KC366_g5963 [Hortaea werneckii]
MATTLTRTTSSPRNTASLLGNTLSPASRSPAQPQANTSPSPLAAAKSAVASVTPSKSPIPGTPTQQPSSPALSTPGAWQHPRMDEVLRRRDANRFDKSHMQMIALNLALLILTFLTSTITRSILPRTLLTSSTYQSTTFYTHLLLRAFLTLNIALSLAPLFRPQDPCDDIPLTDSQRYHLGLPPRTRPATPMEEKNYVTPPRYSRNSTPQSDRASLRLFASDSPLGTRSAGASPLDRSLGGRGGSLSGSPFASPSQRPSPLGARPTGATGMNSSPRRRSSFQGATQRGSPLSGFNDLDGFGSSVFGGSTGTPTKSSGATTTPVGKASVGLNSKWLYEKGWGSPRGGGGGGGGGGSGFAGFGGGGSVLT